MKIFKTGTVTLDMFKIYKVKAENQQNRKIKAVDLTMMVSTMTDTTDQIEYGDSDMTLEEEDDDDDDDNNNNVYIHICIAMFLHQKVHTHIFNNIITYHGYIYVTWLFNFI